MPQPQYGYDKAVLDVGISATDAAIKDLDVISRGVNQLSEEIPLVNKSRSGGIQHVKLQEWISFFWRTRTKIYELNTRLKEVGMTNQGADDDANVTAS